MLCTELYAHTTSSQQLSLNSLDEVGLLVTAKYCFPARHCLIGPLLDGMVVCKRVLPSLIRQTVVNICTAYRVDAEE